MLTRMPNPSSADRPEIVPPQSVDEAILAQRIDLAVTIFAPQIRAYFGVYLSPDDPDYFSSLLADAMNDLLVPREKPSAEEVRDQRSLA